MLTFLNWLHLAFPMWPFWNLSCLHTSCPLSTMTATMPCIYWVQYKYFWNDLILNCVLLMILQRNRINKMYTYRDGEEDFFFGSCHYGGWQSQDLQSASWNLRSAIGVVPTWMLVGLRPRKSQCFSLSPKSGKQKQKQKHHSSSNQAGRIPVTCRKVGLFFYSGLQLIGWGPLTLGRAVCFNLVYWFKC